MKEDLEIRVMIRVSMELDSCELNKLAVLFHSNFQTLKSQQSIVENQSILTITYFKKAHERLNESKFKKAHESCRFFSFLTTILSI